MKKLLIAFLLFAAAISASIIKPVEQFATENNKVRLSRITVDSARLEDVYKRQISPRPMFFITGENAHSREFSEDAYRLAAEPKELYIVPGAGHVDLYDRVSLIPFDKLESFFKEYLKK